MSIDAYAYRVFLADSCSGEPSLHAAPALLSTRSCVESGVGFGVNFEELSTTVHLIETETPKYIQKLCAPN